MYHAEATSLEGFVQQLVCYIASGYRWYVTGIIPSHKRPSEVDASLLSKYDVSLSKYQRARRKRSGKANVQYLRLGRFFVLIATSPIGGHAFSRAERSALRDIRKQPVRIAGYAISSRRDGSELKKGAEKWRAHVRIDRDTYLNFRDYYIDRATRISRQQLEATLGEVPFEPYAPVRRQLLGVLRRVNERRRAAGLLPIRRTCLRFRRKSVRPFGAAEDGTEGRVAATLVFVLAVLVVGWQWDALGWAALSLAAIAALRWR